MKGKDMLPKKDTKETNLQIVKHDDSIVRLNISPAEALASWEQYVALGKAVLTPDDFQMIGDKPFKKKSAWRKLANFFNLNVEILSETRVEEKDGSFSFDVLARA